MALMLLILSLPKAWASLQARQCDRTYMDRQKSHLKMRCHSVEEV